MALVKSCRTSVQDAFPKLSRDAHGLPATLRRAPFHSWLNLYGKLSRFLPAMGSRQGK